MGKGNRNSQQRMNDKLAMEEKNLAKERARKSKKSSDRWVAVACIVLAALIVGILVLNVLAETGVFIRATNAVTIANDTDIVVNAAMMTYFVNDYMTSWYNQYYVYVMYGLLSVDMSSNLRDQKITSNDASYLGDSSLTGKTWYDYFMDATVENVEMYLTYAYNGKNVAECALDEEDYAEIDETIAELKKSLKDNGTTLSEMYGRGVTETDVRACYELIQRASKFGEYKKEYFESELEKDDADVKKYPEDNKGSFYTAKYLSYSVTVSEKTEGSQAKYDQAVKDATAAMEKIKAAKTPADFVQLIELYKKSPSAFLKDDTKVEASTSTGTEKETTVEELIDKYTGTISWQTGDELGDWIFEETAQEGDATIITEESTEVVTEKKPAKTEKETGEEDETKKDNKIEYEKFKITVYMLIEEPTLDHSATHNMAYLITTDQEAAKAVLAAYVAGTDKSRDEFVKIAEKKYDEVMGAHVHTDDEDHTEPTFNFASVDRAKEEYFSDSYSAMNMWLDSAARVDGSYTDAPISITVDNSDKTKTTYYAVLLFENHDVEAWYADAFTAVTQQMIDEWYESELDKKLITYNWDVIDDIL